jgi:hypothetical protein
MCAPEIPAGLAAALAAFNADITNPPADQTAHVKSKRTGVEFDYPYADLGGISDAVRPVLAKHGLSVVQPVEYTDDRAWVGARTILVHESGSFGFPPVWVPVPDDGAAQDIGKAISYSRRYGYLSALGLAAREDGDGPAAGRRRQGANDSSESRGHGRPPRSGSRPAASNPPALGEAGARDLVAVANRKGKTAEDVKGFLEAIGYHGELAGAAPALAARVAKRLEGMPDLFDANGEAIAAAEQPALSAPVADGADTPFDADGEARS